MFPSIRSHNRHMHASPPHHRVSVSLAFCCVLSVFSLSSRAASCVSNPPSPGASLGQREGPYLAPLLLSSNAFYRSHIGARRVVFILAPVPALRHDGYRADESNGVVTITAPRPRGFLYAAGDPQSWLGKCPVLRDPAFAIRVGLMNSPRRTVAEYVAATGVNTIFKLAPGHSAGRLADFARECRAADVDFMVMPYGNDYERWDAKAYAAAIAAHPEVKGTSATNSWERGTLCPSQSFALSLIADHVGEILDQSAADGLYATFWDHYGLFCQCPTCRANGMNTFSNELAACVSAYAAAAQKRGKPLVVRTWASGCPHWLGDKYVHAPGYGPEATPSATWGHCFAAVPASVIFQTKVYNCDCEPNAPLSPLLGLATAAGHREIAEWQMTGQTTGRYYFPAPVVDHTAATMREAFRLVTSEGGVSLHAGGTKRGASYEVLDDPANSINVYAWRALSWNPTADVAAVWIAWATEVYGPVAAPAVVKILRPCEFAADRTFSPLGLGGPTESAFPKNVARREVLLRYTNRYYLPEGVAALAPTKDNIARVFDEKAAALARIDSSLATLDASRALFTPVQYDDLHSRLAALRLQCSIWQALDTSLWRLRYLRALAAEGRTDSAELAAISKARAFLRSVDRKRLAPGLGSPRPLMDDIFNQAQALSSSGFGSEPRPFTTSTKEPTK